MDPVKPVKTLNYFKAAPLEEFDKFLIYHFTDNTIFMLSSIGGGQTLAIKLITYRTVNSVNC